MGAVPNNNRSIASQLMRRFLTENSASAHSFASEENEFTRELSPLLPKKVDTGSYGETVGDQRRPPCSGWTTDSIRFVLPKYCSRCLLSSFQQVILLNMYADLYSVPQSDI